jgi:glycosyltransferase involved in cell wall biosynthesis
MSSVWTQILTLLVNWGNTMRILVECTFVFNNPHVKSGIQRVVRNIINQLPEVDSQFEIVPITFRGNQTLKVTRLEPRGINKQLFFLRAKGQALITHYWLWHQRLEQLKLFSNSHNMRRLLFVLTKICSLGLILPLRCVEVLTSDFHRADNFVVSDEDVLVLLDSSWHQRFFGPVEALKSRGVKIISVVYDLIPVMYSRFYNDAQINVFSHWLAWTAKNADGYLTISKTVRDDLMRYLSEHNKKIEEDIVWIEDFYLGSELDELSLENNVREKLTSLYEASQHIFLTVSTIEPRKNHAYQLDAFDLLWASGSHSILCIVGRVGWKSGTLVKRIHGHPEFNRRLFMFNDLTDSELRYAYTHSSALIFSSFVEGFGLPLVEAQQHGLRVFCSDIPVFREIGADGYAYFDLKDPCSLVQLISSYEKSGVFPAGEIPPSVAISWKESAQRLIAKVEANV